MADFIIERFHEDPPRKNKFMRKAHVRVFTDAQLVQGYSWVRAHEHQAEYRQQCRLWRFGLGTGLRQAEIIHQRKGTTIVETDSGGATVSVNAEWSKTGRPRVTPCTPELVPFLILWLQDRSEGEYLFHKVNGSPYTTRTLERWWNEVCELAGLPNLDGLHGARHTYATQELMSGRLELWQVSQFLGHSKFSITVDNYAWAFAELAYQDHTDPQWRDVALCKDKPALRIAG